MGEVPLLSIGSGRRTGPRISSDLVGSSPAMLELKKTIARVAPSAATVLISGPSGSGKENAARALHAASKRAAGPFEAVNCGAIPAELAEAELFGAEAGAYTGLNKRRIGRLEAAQGGTLFLDEIGDLPLPLQVKLLRALETRQIERLGGGRPVSVDFRLIAATNIDLESAVSAGRFRSDLYWRLAVVWLDLPPLCARMGDIPDLVRYFAGQLCSNLELSDCGRGALEAYEWPGNLRELRNLVERTLAHGKNVLDADCVSGMLHPRRRSISEWLQSEAPAETFDYMPPSRRSTPLANMNLKSLMAEAEMALISEALAASGGTIAHSARMLGMKRTTLIEKMKRMGLKAANEAA